MPPSDPGLSGQSSAVTSLSVRLWGEGARPPLPQCLLVLFAQESPDPWESLDPFNSLDSRPFKKGNWVEDYFHLVSGLALLGPKWWVRCAPYPWAAWWGLCSRGICPDTIGVSSGRPYSVPACVEEAPGQKRKRKGGAKLQDFHQWYLAACEWPAGLGRVGGRGPSPARAHHLLL